MSHDLNTPAAVVMDPEETDIDKLPNLVSRVKAVFIDFVIMLVVFSLTSIIIGLVNDVSDFIKGFIAVTMFILYDPLLTAFTGGTLGHKMMGLRVKKYSDTKTNISVINAILRFVIKGTMGWLSFLTVTSSKNKRAIHDTLSGSIVLG
jgi:uncharacterized RDD family membrane protein YckC